MALGASLAAGAAAAMPAKNLGFEAWDARGQPEGWRVDRSDRFAVSQDCAAGRKGGCALRIRGEGSIQEPFLPLAQPMGAGAAAGHRLKLSGWIRTEAVEEGWAGLWARADVEGKPMVLENMHRDGPRGTSAWKRVEVAIDVPSNATLVSFGVLLSGRGTAWFDDLALDVDASVKVGRAVKTEVVVPPRPAPGTVHVPDDSLRLPSTETPKARAEWREQVQAAAKPIRSLAAEDFSDLQFLKPLLAGKRVVQLGESAHGVAEFNWMKVRLVKFLHRELGFDVVAFESSLSGCDLADQRIGTAAPVDVMRDAIFGVWHSTETLGLFEYLDAQRSAGQRITLAGFDVQNSGRAGPEVTEGLVRQLQRVDADLARRIESYEGRLRRGLDAALAAEMKAGYRAAAERLAAERGALKALEARPAVVDLAIQELRSRVRYIDQLAAGTERTGGRSRDGGMADNLDFLLDTLHPGRKVIVWAHNGHVGRHAAGSQYEGFMGSLVSARRPGEVYTIGLYMGWGIAAQNDRRRYEIRRADDDTLEAVLANGGWRLSFVDLSGAAAGSWARSRLRSRDWGINPAAIVPAEVYDALIYIDAVTPPEYL